MDESEDIEASFNQFLDISKKDVKVYTEVNVDN